MQDLQSLCHLLSPLAVAAFLHHYITPSRDPSAPTSLTLGQPVMPLSVCHTCASRCRLPNWECGSGDGFRLRQKRKQSRSVGCQVIAVLVEALLRQRLCVGTRGRASAFPAAGMAWVADACLLLEAFRIAAPADPMIAHKESNCLSLFPRSY